MKRAARANAASAATTPTPAPRKHSGRTGRGSDSIREHLEAARKLRPGDSGGHSRKN